MPVSPLGDAATARRGVAGEHVVEAAERGQTVERGELIAERDDVVEREVDGFRIVARTEHALGGVELGRVHIHVLADAAGFVGGGILSHVSTENKLTKYVRIVQECQLCRSPFPAGLRGAPTVSFPLAGFAIR